MASWARPDRRNRTDPAAVLFATEDQLAESLVPGDQDGTLPVRHFENLRIGASRRQFRHVAECMPIRPKGANYLAIDTLVCEKTPSGTYWMHHVQPEDVHSVPYRGEQTFTGQCGVSVEYLLG